ncbi:uncharacterized protein si:dkey-91i10.2 [Morone saxatilis]|uniref:uncharacterized protein si:dkey-91i10.2 n=1 Tax=Morone saxatilis TaxID=34816 RepID=UPI0015E2061D|nr:uncharacterized protein si:dkey-91i10.2 [Morone saxatilis]
MPDVKPPPPCDYPSTSSIEASGGSPAGCASPLDLIIDMEPCIANLPLSPDSLASYPHRHRPSVPHYPGHQGPPFPLMARCNSSTLLTNLGLRYCSNRQDILGVGPDEGLAPGSCIHTGSNGSRPYRSMENLNWNTVVDPGLCTFSAPPYKSVDSEFILRYTSSSHWCGSHPDGSVVGAHGLVPNPESLAFYPRHGLPRKDLPLFPQLLFPGGVDEWDARKGLREKLRLQSARSSAEPLKPLPLRPQVTPSAAPIEREGVHHYMNSVCAVSKPLCAVRITSPEEIKQEVLRRLQLRRQNSSPNLALLSSPSSPRVVKTSYTTDNIAGNRSGSDSASERCRPPVGRLHIPTFEEFKRMRQQEGEQSKESTAGSVVSGKPENDLPQEAETSDSKTPSDGTVPQSNSSGGNSKQQEDSEEVEGEMSTGERTGNSGESLQTVTSSERSPCSTVSSNSTEAPTPVFSTYSPIRTGPSPRTPLQPLASSAPEKASATWGDDGNSRRRRSSLEPAGSVPFPPSRENWDRPSSCCPALLLEGTDLSSYGAKIYKMKDGLIGSALDLIKKSCSAEISAEAPVRLSGDRDGGCDITAPSTDCQLSAVAMATSATACRAEAGNETPAGGGGREEAGECHTGLGCRRSSSDAAYELAETVRAQRECRLRPHYSDPMPADASKRKQLEMKIAAAARLHSHRRDRDRDRDRDSAHHTTHDTHSTQFPCSDTSCSCPVNQKPLIDHWTSGQRECQGDEDLLTVYIGEIFLEFVNMLPAFQTYCLQQSTSVNMLNTLEKEKELLRIFLDVSQNDNTALRRMNLRSFLMAPLQRVTKYPLLLSRIIKVTPECHPDYARLREAKSRVESHLEHINMKTKQEGNGVTWSLRSFRRDSRKNREVINIEMREVSMKTVGWARENTRFVMEGPLQLSQPADGQWLRKGSKALKFQNVQSLLMVRTQRAGEAPGQGTDLGARGDQGEGGGDGIRDGVLVLIKDKSSGKFTVLREPIRLGNCVVSTDPDCEDTFEVLDIRRESFVFRASDKSRTQQWFHQIKRYARDLGTWRKRRNALPNIMINTNQSRS